MKQILAESLKLMSAIGVVPGLKVGFQKNLASKDFAVQLPGQPKKTWVRKGTSDWNVFKQVFIWKEYNYPYKFNVENIIDAGANVGYAALWFANRFTQAKIVSLEPETSNFEMLKKNTSGYHNISCIKGGLWSHSCKLRIADDTVSNWGFRTVETGEAEGNTIQAYSVDDVMRQHQMAYIDILKMDVEGAEKTIFEADYDKWLPNTRCLIIELHDDMQQGTSKTFFNVISKYDFSFDVLGENLFFFNNNLIKE